MKRLNKIGVFGLVLGGLLLLGAKAHAIPVTYTTTGKFAAPANPGLPVFSMGGVTITYNSPIGGPQTVDANPTTNASFGFFSTVGTTAVSPVPISTPFTLTIQQALVGGQPAPGAANFSSQITGTLQINSSGAELLFDPPLSQQISGGAALPVLYQIVNAADMVAGKILIAPPTSNNGITAIEGRITVIPEPSAVVLMGMGAVAPLALLLRRRTRARAEA